VTRAFDKAWEVAGAKYSSDADREAARMRLATIVLEIARQGILQEELLVKMAADAMKRPLH
jgi:hypothetical protein